MKVDYNDLIRSIDIFNGNMLVGTRDGSIWHISPSTGSNLIMSSHSDGEVWGLDTHQGKVLTTGDDNKVILWNPEKRTMESKSHVSESN